MDIYADNAAFKPLLPQVKELIYTFLECNYCNPSAIYSNGRLTRRIIEQAREKVAQAIGADANEIYFASGSTEAINWFFYTTWLSNRTHIFTTSIEHKAILRQVNRCDCMHTIKVDKNGEIITKGLIDMLDSDSAVVVGYVNNEIGTIQPIKEITDICHASGAKIFVDATQALGNIPINVHELGIDYLCGSGQKLGALSGCGFLYVKKGSPLEPMILGGDQERGMRAGTENILGIITLAAAINIVTQNIDIKASITARKRDNIISSLLQIPKSHLNGSLGNRVCGNINIAFEGIDSESLVLQCDLNNVQCASGSACNSKSLEPSHVLKAIGLDDDLARASIRITIDETTTDEQVEYIIMTIRKCVEKLRANSPKWKEIYDESN